MVWCIAALLLLLLLVGAVFCLLVVRARCLFNNQPIIDDGPAQGFFLLSPQKMGTLRCALSFFSPFFHFFFFFPSFGMLVTWLLGMGIPVSFLPVHIWSCVRHVLT